MRIRNIKLENYRGFIDATIDLDRRLTVMVGLNGSGKSSVLTAIAVVCSQILRIGGAMKGARAIDWCLSDVDVHRQATACAVISEVATGERSSRVAVRHARGVPSERYDRSRSSSPLADLDTEAMFLKGETLPVYYVATRGVAAGSVAFSDTGWTVGSAPPALVDALDPARGEYVAFGSLFRWLKNREDVENEEKVSRQDLSIEDPELRAVRRAVAGLLPGFSGLRVQRDPLHLIISKDGVPLALDQLSDGEKLLLAMTADLARRLALTYSDRETPLDGTAIVLIDEVELHLHAGWQRSVLPNLLKTFPGCQFIVTTHSPQVISSVPGDAVVLLDDFKVVRPGLTTKGRDSNAILREILGVAERPDDALEKVRNTGALLDDGRLDEGRAALANLERELGSYDDEVVRLKTRLDFLEMPLAADER